MSKLCDAANCARVALDKVVCDAVAVSALDFYAQVVQFIKDNTGLDVAVIFQAIAALAVLCWVQEWLLEIIRFLCRVPRFIKNLFCGKINLCILNCNKSKSCSKSSSSSSSSSSTSSFDY
mgnify:CR=1 FL=1